MQGNDRLPETIGGYRIVRRLAREATVDVLLARTQADGARGEARTVVLKLVSPTFRGDASFEQTFVRETQAISQLDHPNIVRLCDVFSGTDVKAMVLEHVDGLTLSELRAALTKRNEVLPDAASFAIAAAVYSALAAAHAARDPQTGNLLPIVHRDIFPGQIIIGRDGSVKLGGFGLERITGVRGDARTPEARGYLPPEKARGEAITIRSDVYAAALVAWELLARRRAVRDDALPEQELARALSQPSIVSLEVLRPDLPSLVRSIVTRALEPQIERRAVTAEEAGSIFRSAGPADQGRQLLAQAVVHALDGAPPEPVGAPEPSLPRFPMQSSPSSPELAPLAGPVSERPGAPRPNPRRMWGSSPTFTPSAPVVAPSSSSRGSIPDARLSHEPMRSPTPPPPPPSSVPAPLPPQAQSTQMQQQSAPPPPAFSDGARRPPSSARTAMGGFNVSSLKPLLDASTAPPSAPPPPPPPTSRPPRPTPSARPLPTPEPLFAMPTPSNPPSRAAEQLPGMAVPLATGVTILEDMSPMPPAVNAPLPPPPPHGMAPFWSTPPSAPESPLVSPAPSGPPPSLIPPMSAPTAPTIRYAAHKNDKAKRRSSALFIGLFMLAAAVGATGFAWLFRRSAQRAPSVTTATPIASVRPSASTNSSAAITAKPPPPSTLVAAPVVSAPSPSSSIAAAPPSAAPAPSTVAAPSAAPAPSAMPSSAPSPSAAAVAGASAALGGAATPKPTEPALVPEAVTAAAGATGANGAVRFDKRAAGHRVFIDGRVVGEGEGPYTVSCGAHTVRIGSKGKAQKVDVPCGSEITVVAK